MSPSRVAVVAPYGADPVMGVLHAAVHSAAAVATGGMTVELWLPHPWPAAGFEELIGCLEDAGVPRIVLQPVGRPRPWLDRAAVRRAARRRVDVLHVHGAFSPHVAQLAKGSSVPVVFTPHGALSPAALRRSRARKAFYTLAVERPLTRRCTAVVALTEAEAQDLRRWGVGAPIVVIPNGVQPAPAADPLALRRELGLPAQQRLLLYVGRLDPVHKGLDQLVDALAGAPEWTLALVGPDDHGQMAALQARAARGGAGQRRLFLGVRQGSRLRDAYAGADALALVSRWEGMPLALLEALSHGLPAVVSPVVERAVPVGASGAGWVAGSRDLARTLRAIAGMTEGEWRAREHAARALAGAYRWEEVGAELAGLYARAAGARPARDR